LVLSRVRKILESFTNRLIGFLKQGITPEKLALTLALGAALGTVPMLGTTTILCTIAAFAFGLNLAAIQLINGIVYPLQLILIIPFLRAGAWLFRTRDFTFTLSQIFGLVHTGVWHAITTLWTATVHALAVWLIAAGLSSTILYFALRVILKRLWRESRRADVDAALAES
jgi:uncharacterized protein (DUF2062 family)